MQFQRLIGIVPLGIGLTVLIGVWTMPYSGFGAMPIFFRVFASFIALMFVLIGGGAIFGLTDPAHQMRSRLTQLRQMQQELQPKSGPAKTSGSGNYQCTSCGATLDNKADVSPHGDVKCDHCGKWFNIHQSA